MHSGTVVTTTSSEEQRAGSIDEIKTALSQIRSPGCFTEVHFLLCDALHRLRDLGCFAQKTNALCAFLINQPVFLTSGMVPMVSKVSGSTLRILQQILFSERPFVRWVSHGRIP